MQLGKYAEKYMKDFRLWIEPLFVEKQPEIVTERCCLSLTSNEISLIYINKTRDTCELISSDCLYLEEAESLPHVLSSFLKRHTLSSIPTYLLLSPDDYQIFLIESLPVKSEEFREALNWRVRSLINFPIEDAIVDYFKLPKKKSSLDNIVSAVTVKRNKIVALIDVLKKSGFNLTVIDIPELAMRNLTALYEDDEKSSAFIYFYDHVAILNITREKSLYFTRHINLTSKNQNSSSEYEQISLEILRYFDYFQSQWRHPTPTRIFVASEKRNPDDIASKLSEYLLQTVEPFHLKDILGDTAKIHSIEKKNLLPFGCALREDGNDVSSRN